VINVPHISSSRDPGKHSARQCARARLKRKIGSAQARLRARRAGVDRGRAPARALSCAGDGVRRRRMGRERRTSSGSRPPFLRVCAERFEALRMGHGGPVRPGACQCIVDARPPTECAPGAEWHRPSDRPDNRVHRVVRGASAPAAATREGSATIPGCGPLAGGCCLTSS